METKIMFRMLIVIAALMVVAAACSTPKIDPGVLKSEVTVYKSGGCGCCGVFTKYLSQQGFSVDVKNTESMSVIKDKFNIPGTMQSCHTSMVDKYFVEGHVPAQAIEKLLTEKPDIAGIAVPGMPSGSPGMPGAKMGKITVYSVHKDGAVDEFMQV